MGDALFDTIDRIGQNPLAFRECEEILTADKIYRKAVCQSWLIIYKINPVTGLSWVLFTVHANPHGLIS